MKKFLLALFTICLIVSFNSPAYAAEVDSGIIGHEPTQEEQQPEDQRKPQEPPVTVSTLEELRTAIDAAEDGDTIIIDDPTMINDGDMLISNKDITLIRSAGLENSGRRMLELCGAGTISGFTFIEDGWYHGTISSTAEGNGDILIENCTFKAAGDNRVEYFIIANIGDSVTIRGCTFYCGSGYVLYSHRDTEVLIDSCTFLKGKYYSWFMVAAYGDTTVRDCTFEDGTGYITASLDGKITLSDCKMTANHYKNRIYPNIYLENKISGAGRIDILDEPKEGEGFYNLFTGEKVTLPLVGLDDISALSYMTDEQATAYFAVEGHIGQFDVKAEEKRDLEEEEFDPEPPTTTDEGNPADTPQEPGDQTGDDDTTGEERPPQKPVQPPEGEGTDNPDNGDQDDSTDTPPENPKQPTEPPKDDTTDNPADTTPDTPQQPQKPADGDNSNNDNSTPPTDYRPSQRPIWPIVTVKPTEGNKPQDQPDNNPAPAKPQLVCNEAVIDTSRTVVLLGYGDGLIHENDPLTRAQMATVIYRLLDDESIALCSNAQVAFADVAADAWYAPYVSAIGAAGIVNGVGDGKYDPEGLLTWGQTLTILSRFVEQKEYTLRYIQYNGWALQSIKTAVANGWIMDSVAFSPDAVISRGELEQLINSVLELYRT